MTPVFSLQPSCPSAVRSPAWLDGADWSGSQPPEQGIGRREYLEISAKETWKVGLRVRILFLWCVYFRGLFLWCVHQDSSSRSRCSSESDVHSRARLIRVQSSAPACPVYSTDGKREIIVLGSLPRPTPDPPRPTWLRWTDQVIVCVQQDERFGLPFLTEKS